MYYTKHFYFPSVKLILFCIALISPLTFFSEVEVLAQELVNQQTDSVAPINQIPQSSEQHSNGQVFNQGILTAEVIRSVNFMGVSNLNQSTGSVDNSDAQTETWRERIILPSELGRPGRQRGAAVR